MRSIISGYSGNIVVNVAIRYIKIEKQGGAVIFMMKHEFSDFKNIDLENV